jgi:hypothetical protein
MPEKLLLNGKVASRTGKEMSPPKTECSPERCTRSVSSSKAGSTPIQKNWSPMPIATLSQTGTVCKERLPYVAAFKLNVTMDAKPVAKHYTGETDENHE